MESDADQTNNATSTLDDQKEASDKNPIQIEVTNAVRSEEMVVQFNNADRIFIGRKTQCESKRKRQKEADERGKPDSKRGVPFLIFIHSQLDDHYWVYRRENPTHPAARYRRRCNHIDAASRPQIPESDCFILRSADEHRSTPVVKRQHVAAVAAQGLERCTSRAIGNVNLAIASTAADQKARLVRRVLEETQVAHRTIVHGQFDLLP